MTQYATWASYGGDARTWLALGLLAAAAATVLAGLRLPLPVQAAKAGRAAKAGQAGPAGRAVTLAAWATSVMALLLCSSVYFQQAESDIRVAGLSQPAVKLTILPVTLTAAAVLFVIIASRGSAGLSTRLASAAVGAIAAPVIFELPFDPIVVARIHLGVPHPPPVALVYVPLVLTEVTTLLLLRLSPLAWLTRATFFSFALMLGVWAAWAALAGFGYPSAPLPIALNIASKILAFVTAFTLFPPRPPAPSRPAQPGEQGDPVRADATSDRFLLLSSAGVSDGPDGCGNAPVIGGWLPQPSATLAVTVHRGGGFWATSSPGRRLREPARGARMVTARRSRSEVPGEAHPAPDRAVPRGRRRTALRAGRRAPARLTAVAEPDGQGPGTRAGVELLTRTTRSVGLTEAGVIFASMAGRAVRDLETAVASVAGRGRRPGPPVARGDHARLHDRRGAGRRPWLAADLRRDVPLAGVVPYQRAERAHQGELVRVTARRLVQQRPRAWVGNRRGNWLSTHRSS